MIQARNYTLEKGVRHWRHLASADTPTATLSASLLLLLPLVFVCLSVLQHGPRVSLGCRSNEFLDHAKT